MTGLVRSFVSAPRGHRLASFALPTQLLLVAVGLSVSPLLPAAAGGKGFERNCFSCEQVLLPHPAQHAAKGAGGRVTQKATKSIDVFQFSHSSNRPRDAKFWWREFCVCEILVFHQLAFCTATRERVQIDRLSVGWVCWDGVFLRLLTLTSRCPA